MKKFWRSGMIDKKIVVEREQNEYINKLQRTILELNRKPPEPEPRYAIVHTSDNRSHKVRIADDYDEVRVGDETILDFGETIIAAPKERLKDSMFNAYCGWLKNRGPYDSDIDFEKKAFNEICKDKEFKEK